MTIVEDRPVITGGVDTHAGLHVAAALDPIGGLLGVREFPATAAGYAALLGWLSGFGDVAPGHRGGHRELWRGPGPLSGCVRGPGGGGPPFAAGMRLEPTGRNPRHYTVSFHDLEDGVQRLVRCPHQVMPNVYHDA
jgi:hypothetical protein